MFKLPKSSIFLIIVVLCCTQFTTAQNRPQEVNHYILPEFTKGIVLMKSGIKNELMINYNSLSEEMIFEKGSTKLAIGKTESEYVDTIYMEDRKFVELQGKFVEVIFTSANMDLFVQHKCKISYAEKSVGLGRTSSTTNVDTYSGIQSDGQVFNLENAQDYNLSPYLIYWILKNGRLYEAINMKRLEKVYRDQKDQFRDYVKENNVKFDDPDKVLALVRHLDTL